ncbi:MAG: DNA mismatch repair protein MutS [Bacteroidota bacterium]
MQNSPVADKKKDGMPGNTPLSKQYNAIKAKYPGALLLFRVGDFYETFGEDAIKSSKILGITLTKRGSGSESETALAGFPHHSLDNYLPKLVRAGQRVAICDQLEDPKFAQGIVKRGVTELVTPGVSFNDNVLEVKQNNYLASLHLTKDIIGISFLDASTGEFFTSQGHASYIDKLLQSFSPSEILFCKKQRHEFNALFGDKYHTFQLDDWVFAHDFAYDSLTQHFQTNSLKGFGIENLREGIISAGAILHYLAETEHREMSHISSISRLEEDRYVWLDRFTIRNLELVSAQQDGGVPLIQVLDHTVTPMGARLMRKWLVLPLKETAPINERLNTVAFFSQQSEILDGLLQHLRQIGDLERLISKVAVRRISPRELLQLKRSLQHTVPIKQLLQAIVAVSEVENVAGLKKYADQLNPCEFLLQKIENELREDPPIVSNLGGMIKSGVNPELDELHQLAFQGKDYLMQLQNREIQRTGIGSLKIAFNKVFGYYLEVTNAHKDKVPTEWIRKQTLVNAERYITQELKEYEDKILNAEDRIFAIEQKLFNELVITASEYVTQIQQNARILARIDCLSSFAKVAIKNRYIRPVISEARVLRIEEGRHPVIEQQLPLGESYIPNDIFLDDETQQIIIITGPNMAGKSALLRQVALITLMAQMGSFVPAKAAEIGLVDKIFTRVGASDNLSKGESTFMVEMTETASILNNLSDRSLVLMDEIGRGTSTYDGISIAWSIVEYLHNHSKCRAKTLFATHYHELNQLAEDFPRIKNYNVSVKEVGNKVIFMRKLKEGGSEHSFGIHVAQMAGMPNNVVIRANEIMHHLEKDKIRQETGKRLTEVPKNNYQLKIFESSNPKFEKIEEMLRHLDINTISPVEALLKLNEVKRVMDT